jgi:AraC-like DNA-binding protein
MALIAAYLPSGRSLSRLEGALGHSHAIRACASWAELDRCCAAHPVTVAVVDLYGDGSTNFDAVRGLRARYGSIPLVAYVAALPDQGRDLFDLGRAGVGGLLLMDIDDRPRIIQQVIERAEARGVSDDLRRLLGGHPPLVRDAVLVSVSRAHEDLDGDRLATILATPRRTLSQVLSDLGFPPPAKLITWGRLIVAAQMLNDRQRSADAVARVLGFPSGSAFRNTCQRYLGLRPNEIRSAGGPTVVIDRFLVSAGLPPQ